MKYLLMLVMVTFWSFDAQSEVSPDFGKELYEAKCVQCHGEPGRDLKAPIISGMPYDYLYTQLVAFNNGTRYDRLMFAMNEWTDELNDEEMQAIAHYVSQLNPCDITFNTNYTEGDRLRGEELFFDKGCVACHDGKDALRARLDRQKGDYLLYALASFKTKIRRKPVMEDMVVQLTDEEQRDLAQYFNSIDFCEAEQH